MATIQLDQEVLDVERLIDERAHDESFRQLILLRDRFGRRPEYRYLKALFDATFDVRSDQELLVEVRALVAEQPDFLEAVSLLAVLLHRTGDQDRAMVFAREAVHAVNENARQRAQQVLGGAPAVPTADEEPFARRSSSSLGAVRPEAETTPDASPDGPPEVGPEAARSHPIAVPSPETGNSTKPRKTQAMFRAEHPEAPVQSDPFRLPSEPPPLQHDVESGDTLEGLPRAPSTPPPFEARKPATMPPPPEPSGGPSLSAASKPSTIPPQALPSEPPGVMHGVERPPTTPVPDARGLASETIPFSPADVAMPPPPTIPPDAPESPSPPARDLRQAPTLEGFRAAKPRDEASDRPRPRQQSLSPVPSPHDASGPVTRRADQTSDRPPPIKRAPTPLPPEYAVDRTGVDRRRTASRPSRPAMAIPEPERQVRGWFQFARERQLQAGEGFSTARTLLDLCERVVQGATPLSSDPIPLDRRGLILVEERLEAIRGGRVSSQQAAGRGAVTAAAAFLLGLLLKECDGKASDTSAEDGACKVVVPSGATVRPLLVAAAFARSRGPGLVETFDRAATAHMRRGPTRRTGPSRAVTQPRQETAPKPSSEFDITVLRRDLDASTLGVTDPQTPPAPQPGVDMREIAVAFWSSELGRELIGTSRRVGTFTIADVDAIERYASKTFGAVGFAPPGTPWPWSPNEDLEELIFSWGGILGEVLVGLYSGRWEADPGNPEDRHLFRVVLSGGVVAWPVAKAYMRLARGIPHDLSVYIDAVGRVVGRQALGAQGWPKS